MEVDKEEKFRIADLAEYSEADLTRILKTRWGYSDAQPFDVIGRLNQYKKIQLDGVLSLFYILEDLHSFNDGTSLLYPLHEPDVRHTVFVGSIKKEKLGGEVGAGAWVKARVELSPKTEREKRNNPFALKVTDGGLQMLQAIPEEAAAIDFIIDGMHYVEKWVCDFYRDKNHQQITQEGDSLRVQLQQDFEREENKLSELQNKNSQLSEKLSLQSESLSQVSEELAAANALRDKTQIEFNQQKKTMEHQLNTLNHFIEQKAKMLVDLDLLGQEEADNLLGRISAEQVQEGHSFSDIFEADVTQAVGYVQAFMYHKGIVYRRKVLEDFFALLTMHDLIILAGDSGSGKTNLVKSFADAIGGKAVIIPVKPNWTSAEDLLGYYNPLEQKYLTTPFLDALFDASRNPDVPYFICLDEMNLARVEYYFADFLSLMEERVKVPEIYLYSDAEAGHLISEIKTFLSLIDEAKTKLDKPDLMSFLELLRDESLNAKLHELCGFRAGDSLLKYHAYLRKLLSSYLNTPSSIRLPPNVRIIGAINVDETTHYLSPKILDRAHIVRFSSPLLSDWAIIEGEVTAFELDLKVPVIFGISNLGQREDYPEFDRNDPLVETLVHLVREFLDPLGIEFGLRFVRQACLYKIALQQFGEDDDNILNNIILHKVLPKLMFDGEKTIDENIARKDKLIAMRDYLNQRLGSLGDQNGVNSCVDDLDRVIRNAKANDWVVNYWSR